MTFVEGPMREVPGSRRTDLGVVMLHLPPRWRPLRRRRASRLAAELLEAMAARLREERLS